MLYVLGERLEDIGIENSKSALDELVSKAPKTAFVKSENANVAIDKIIAVGTIIQVKAGEMIPLTAKLFQAKPWLMKLPSQANHPQRQTHRR